MPIPASSKSNSHTAQAAALRRGDPGTEQRKHCLPLWSGIIGRQKRQGTGSQSRGLTLSALVELKPRDSRGKGRPRKFPTILDCSE